MWCKCQLDYLCTLPNDAERRAALKHLPPDLPATYIRILERLERDYSPQTTELIRRTLKWLVLQRKNTSDFFNLTLPGLAQAISLGEGAVLDYDRIPDEMDIRDWCSSLVRLDKNTHRLELSHFTVEEFLLEKREKIPSEIARQYLVDPSVDMAYLAKTCLLYLSLINFDQTRLIMEQKTFEDFTTRYAFYAHAALQLADYIALVGLDLVESPASRRFFSTKTPGMLLTWNTFLDIADKAMSPKYQKEILRGKTWLIRGAQRPWTALQLSSALLLSAITCRLLKEGTVPNEADDYPASPLHLCIGGPSATHELMYRILHSETRHTKEEGVPQGLIAEQKFRRFSIAQNLLLTRAKANALSEENYRISKYNCPQLNPFCVAVLHLHEDICKLLIEVGASLSPTSDDLGSSYSKLYSVLETVEESEKGSPRFNRILDLLLSLPELGNCLFEFFAGKEYGEPGYDGVLPEDAGSLEVTSALLFAATVGNKTAVRLALLKGADVEARNQDGQSALMLATETGNPYVISEIITKGADVHSFCQGGDSPFTLVLRNEGPEDVKRLFGDKVDRELSNERKVKIFRSACVCGNTGLLDFIVGQGLQIPANEEPLVFDPETPNMDLLILKTAHQYGLLSLEEI